MAQSKILPMKLSSVRGELNYRKDQKYLFTIQSDENPISHTLIQQSTWLQKEKKSKHLMLYLYQAASTNP